MRWGTFKHFNFGIFHFRFTLNFSYLINRKKFVYRNNCFLWILCVLWVSISGNIIHKTMFVSSVDWTVNRKSIIFQDARKKVWETIIKSPELKIFLFFKRVEQNFYGKVHGHIRFVILYFHSDVLARYVAHINLATFII